MRNFTFHNPTKIVFGEGTIAELKNLIPEGRRILMMTGGGSIRKNGVHDQVMEALNGRTLLEYSGIDPNPEYEKCMDAMRLAKKEKTDFLLSVGGGSVLDAAKFTAAAMTFKGGDPWDILEKGAEVSSALPVGCVLTMPATGSESNGNAVISRRVSGRKLAFSSIHVFPRFSILDPATTVTLSERQTANGIVDAFVHVMEQYMTYDVNAPLQDRQAEAVLLTLIEEAPKIKEDPRNYETRANLMWCATQALNTLIACGVPQDWTTHTIGHEITALHGLDHAQTLAIVLPAVFKHQRVQKGKKLVQYARRVWGIEHRDNERTLEAGIKKTEEFFRSVGLPTRLKDYHLSLESCLPAAKAIASRNPKIGEHGDIGSKEIEAILKLAE